MGIVAQHLDVMTVTVTSPDGNIRARLHHRTRVDVEFRPDTYREYRDAALAQQLTVVAGELTEGCRRARHRILSEVAQLDAAEADPRLAAYHSERDRIQMYGMSPDGAILLACTGLRDWGVVVRDGTVRSATELDFTTQLRAAVFELWRQYRVSLHELRQRIAGGAT